MDTVDKLNFYTENKEWKVTKPFRLPILLSLVSHSFKHLLPSVFSSFILPFPNFTLSFFLLRFPNPSNTLTFIYRVDSSTATRSENKYETVAETYPDVTFTFQISRRSPSYRWSSQNGSFLDPCHNFVSLPERQLSSRAFWQCCSLSPRSSFLQLPEKRLLWIQSAF